jgi:archaeal flagellar protein FlaF
MAVAEIIGAAIGVLLLVVVAYILVGGTISVAETVATAQKDLTLMSETRLRTDLRLNNTETSITDSALRFSVTNTGNEVISDFEHVDVFTYDNSGPEYQRYTFTQTPGTAGTWTIVIDNDIIHPGELDPGEKAWVTATFTGSDPVWVLISTNNGVYAQLSDPVAGGWRSNG